MHERTSTKFDARACGPIARFETIHHNQNRAGPDNIRALNFDAANETDFNRLLFPGREKNAPER
jgi:hypothetical protein